MVAPYFLVRLDATQRTTATKGKTSALPRKSTVARSTRRRNGPSLGARSVWPHQRTAELTTPILEADRWPDGGCCPTQASMPMRHGDIAASRADLAT